MKHNFTKKQIQEEINSADKALEKVYSKAFRLWERIRIDPQLWEQRQYPKIDPFWVIGILGRRCLYFNFVEAGWGWGRFKEWGEINEYHWQQDEIHETIHQTLFAIQNGGNG